MEYPKLREGQFALAVAKSDTGHVLNLEGSVSNSDQDMIYHVFSSLDVVYDFIRSRIIEDDTLEFCIYDKDQEIVRYFQNIEARSI